MILEVNAVGIATAFLAGAVSFLSPCVLPLVPGYVSYVAGRSLDDAAPPSAVRILWLSGCFVLGFSTIFVMLGAGANTLSATLRRYSFEANLVGGVLVILFGLITMGLLRVATLEREFRFHGLLPNGGGPFAAYVLGLAFAFGWTPCIGPVLGAILGLASAHGTAASGAAMLAVYSLGLGVPFVLAALFLRGFMARMHTMRRAGRVLRIAAGGIMVAMGLAMMTGRLSDVGIWFLQTFPALGQIG